MIYSDDGFGNLVSIDNPYQYVPKMIKLFTKIEGQLATFESDAKNHDDAIFAVRKGLGHKWNGRLGRYNEGAVLSLVE